VAELCSDMYAIVAI